jgi:large subunit ribosomal protein L31e
MLMADDIKGAAKEAKAIEKEMKKTVAETAEKATPAAQAVTMEGKAAAVPAKPETKKKEEKKKEEKFEEKVYTINLRRAFDKPLKKRARTAVGLVRKKLQRTLKRPVALDIALNRQIWERGAEKPPRSVRVKARIYEKRVVAGIE